MQVTIRAKQAHIKRRQDFDPQLGQREETSAKKKRRVGAEMGHLGSFPGIKEEMFLAYSCPVTEERDHKITMPGIESSAFPEQLISLPDPNKLEPVVTMETKKAIFKPDADGNHRIRDNQVSLEAPDVAQKTMVQGCSKLRLW